MLVVLVFVVTANALAGSGEISPKMVKKLRTSVKMDPHTRAMYNAVTGNDVSSLALNRDIVNSHNEIFSHKIKTKGITNQKSSGRCWLFAGLNVMRPEVVERHKLKSFEFSQNYLAFYDKLEKANCFLERVIRLRDKDIDDRTLEIHLRNPIPDGGYWESVVNLVEKYGAVPKEIMPETNSSSSTSQMNKLISTKLRSDATKLRQMHADEKPLKQLEKRKDKMLAETYKILVLNLGAPPVEFEWRYEDANSLPSEMKTYTPQSFYKDFVDVDLREYVDLFHDPSKETGKHYELGMSTNVIGGDNVNFANIEMEQLKAIAVKSVLDDEPLWFGCDVGKDQYRGDGVGIMAVGMYDFNSVYKINMDMTKTERILYRHSIPNHAMVLVGVDIKDDKPTKWLIENSWGSDKGSKGYWTLYDTWFDEYVYSIIVKKKYVPEEVLKILDKPAEIRPAWDPMFAIVNSN